MRRSQPHYYSVFLLPSAGYMGTACWGGTWLIRLFHSDWPQEVLTEARGTGPSSTMLGPRSHWSRRRPSDHSENALKFGISWGSLSSAFEYKVPNLLKKMHKLKALSQVKIFLLLKFEVILSFLKNIQIFIYLLNSENNYLLYKNFNVEKYKKEMTKIYKTIMELSPLLTVWYIHYLYVFHTRCFCYLLYLKNQIYVLPTAPSICAAV